MNIFEELVICNTCISDNYLVEQLPFKNQNNKRKCANCNTIQVCVEYEYLEKILKRVIINHYTIVTKDVSDPWIVNISSHRFSLEDVVRRLIGSIFKIEEIIDNISTREAIDALNGDNRYLNQTDVYLIPKEYPDLFQQEWNSLVTELKTSRRFFSDKARTFFQKIFKGVENLSCKSLISTSDGLHLNFIDEPVVQVLPIGTELKRARKADSIEKSILIKKNPKKELSPPPSNLAEQGRMNARGVSIFYGACDSKTCIAEMRSSIGNYLILGTFKTVKELRVIDFKILERVYSEISYFQPDAVEQMMKRTFLSKLSSLISSPVVPGREDEYLITQVLAEYLAYVRSKSFDGIAFESTQLKGGTNIILFPKNDSDEIQVPNLVDGNEIIGKNSNLEKFGLEFIQDSVEIFKTEQIIYETNSISL